MLTMHDPDGVRAASILVASPLAGARLPKQSGLEEGGDHLTARELLSATNVLSVSTRRNDSADTEYTGNPGTGIKVRREVRLREPVLWVIENIKELRTKLEMYSLGHRNIFHQA